VMLRTIVHGARGTGRELCLFSAGVVEMNSLGSRRRRCFCMALDDGQSVMARLM
jgi:hypothetical protein